MDSDILVDRIYEAALLPELWPKVLDELAQLITARGGVFFALKKNVFNWTSSAKLRDSFCSYVNGGWLARCPRRTKFFSVCEPRFYVEHDFWTDDELQANPVYRDFLRPEGLGWCAATTITLPTGDKMWLSLERDYARGPVGKSDVEKLDVYRCHLARSALISTRLELQRAQAMSDALQLLGLPALVFNESGKAVATNELVETHSQIIRLGAHDRLVLKDREADALFQQRLASITSVNRSACSFPIRDEFDQAVMVAHVVPLRGQARDLLLNCAGLLTFTPLGIQSPSIELIQSLFDLTPAEARVARDLVAGNSVDEIASQSGVSSHTVRTHVRRVLDKTGCSRQAEVIAMLGGIHICPQQ